MKYLPLNASIKNIVLTCILFIQFTSHCLANEPIYPIYQKDNLNIKKFELGQLLFKEVKLSGNQQTSCQSCHNIAEGGADGLKTSKNLAFNSPSILNVSKNYYFGWQGRFTQLENHLRMLFENPKVMGTNWPFTLIALKKDPLYSELFRLLYKNGISKENIIDSILYYESNLIVPSLFDDFLLGNQNAISVSAKEGYKKFKDYGCASCHQGANVGGNVFQVLGVTVPYNGTDGEYEAKKLRVPSLRNVARTSPYFHNGSIQSLRDAIEIMAKHQLGKELSNEDINQIVDFLTSLNSILK